MTYKKAIERKKAFMEVAAHHMERPGEADSAAKALEAMQTAVEYEKLANEIVTIEDGDSEASSPSQAFDSLSN